MGQGRAAVRRKLETHSVTIVRLMLLNLLCKVHEQKKRGREGGTAERKMQLAN